MRHLSIRFLKQGQVNIEIPNDIDSNHFKTIAKEHLDSMSDNDLICAMSDITFEGSNPSRFDADNFQVEAIKDLDNECVCIESSALWKVYINE